MTTKSAYRSVALALVAVAGLSTAGLAQSSKDSKAAKSPPAKQAPAPTPAPAPAGAGQPTLLGQFGDWGAYTASSSGKKVCYALAKPASQATEPANRPRDPAFIVRVDAPGRECPQRDLDRDRLSVQAGL